jgi:folate-binding protein YgfZ
MPTARLDDRAIVRIAGPDAATLLQNVLTLDLEGMDRNGSGYGALLTPQGKILFDFILHRSADGYAADIRADQAEAFAKRLALYRLRAKVEIAPEPALAVHVAWPDAAGERADPRLSALGARWAAPAGSVKTDAAAADWHSHRIALAIPEGGIDFVFGDSFPHDAAMDSLNGVAFDKGCYVGQEVVSRMRHRGTARRRPVSLSGDGDFPPIGTEIMAGAAPLGRLGSSADGKAVAILRLDRTRAALDAGAPVTIDGMRVDLSLPDWATYEWPVAANSAAD